MLRVLPAVTGAITPLITSIIQPFFLFSNTPMNSRFSPLKNNVSKVQISRFLF